MTRTACIASVVAVTLAAPGGVAEAAITDRPVLVSRASGASGAPANGASGPPAVSANGRFVAFDSEATNLDPADTEPFTDVYVRDLETDTTALVSRASGFDGEKATRISTGPSISADGRYVAFVSEAQSLGYRTVAEEVYVRDLAAETTTLVSRRADGGSGNGLSYGAAISADGSRVAFLYAADLVPQAEGEFTTLFVRDLPSARTIVASPRPKTTNQPLPTYIQTVSISDDGNRALFEAPSRELAPGDHPRSFNVFLRDIAARRTALASRGFGERKAKGNREGVRGAISGNGRFVSFTAGRTNQAEGGGARGQGLFVRDMKARKTIHIPGTPGKGTTESLYSALSRSGRLIAFSSDASDLARGDRNRESDVFVAGLERR